MTKLDAVNAVLRKVGKHPVAALDTDGFSTASEVERHIDDAEHTIQMEGWHYNTVVDDVLSPDGDGFIEIPTGTFVIDTSGSSAYVDVAQRGDRLYNVADRTFEFDDDLTVTYTIRMDWDCIPIFVREYIVAKAAADFYRSKGDRDMRMQFPLDRNEANKRGRAHNLDNNTSDINILSTFETLATKGFRRSYRRNRGAWL